MLLAFLMAFFISLATYAQAPSTNILYIGDSHSTGCFGSTLDRELRRYGNVTSMAACGSSGVSWLNPKGPESRCGFRSCDASGRCVQVIPGMTSSAILQNLALVNPSIEDLTTSCGADDSSWPLPGTDGARCGFHICDSRGVCYSGAVKINGPTPVLAGNVTARGLSLKNLLNSIRPGLTVVALGTNMLKASNRETVMANVRRIVTTIQSGGSQCLWIGPPQAKESFISVHDYDAFVTRLKTTTESMGCRFIDSGDKTSRDDILDPLGIHYSCRWGTLWAEKVSQDLSK